MFISLYLVHFKNLNDITKEDEIFDKGIKTVYVSDQRSSKDKLQPI